jgi:Fe-S-cluster-containing dehydrogenase component
MGGIRVQEIVQQLPKDKAYLTYLPFPTELCVLCKSRTKKGLQPACVQHCMAGCMQYGRIEELSQEMKKKPRMVLWAPK